MPEMAFCLIGSLDLGIQARSLLRTLRAMNDREDFSVAVTLAHLRVPGSRR
jgi:hypothetical protein